MIATVCRVLLDAPNGAVMNGRPELVAALPDAGADPNAADPPTLYTASRHLRTTADSSKTAARGSEIAHRCWR